MSWICDGVPKDGKQYPNCAGEHEPYENSGPDCVVCGLPQEAMQAGKAAKTTVAGTPGGKNKLLMPAIVVGIILVVGGSGFLLFNSLKKKQPQQVFTQETPRQTRNTNLGGLVSQNATNPQLISQGEKILLDSTPNKQAGASAFAQQNWDSAIASYQQAANVNPNDPEGKIYLHNAKARKIGNPLTIAVVVPITSSPDSAKEILRGVASQQEEFNQSPPPSGRLLEVVIVNDGGTLTAASVAQDLVKAPSILGVVGHGLDPGSQQALRKYDAAGLVALSPLTTSVTVSGGQSILKTIPIDQKANELLGNYLQAVGKTLLEYAKRQNSPPKALIFYNSDSPYSMQLKQQLVTALSGANGQLVKEIDITTNSNYTAELQSDNIANTIILALSKNKLNEAISLAQANRKSLTLMGGDELYNPDLLVQGGDTIKDIIIAVPWSFKPNDPFAKDAVNSWKGRVSWRTKTAYDATKALTNAISQNPSRTSIAQLLTQGMNLAGSSADFNIFQEVPLVKAVVGNSGPPGSKYQFDSLE